MLVRIVVALFWLGLAWLAFPHRVPRLIVAIVAAVPLCGYAGFLLFVEAGSAIDRYTRIVLPGYVLEMAGLLLGLVAGFPVGRIAARIGWLYWVIHVALAAIFALWQ
jgi:hypothetical protein